MLGIDYTITNDGVKDYYNFLATGKTMTVTTTTPQVVDYFAIGGGGFYSNFYSVQTRGGGRSAIHRADEDIVTAGSGRG